MFFLLGFSQILMGTQPLSYADTSKNTCSSYSSSPESWMEAPPKRKENYSGLSRFAATAGATVTTFALLSFTDFLLEGKYHLSPNIALGSVAVGALTFMLINSSKSSDHNFPQPLEKNWWNKEKRPTQSPLEVR